MKKKKLREGFTTGSAAAAGAKAALLFLGGRRNIAGVDIPLPVGGRLTVPVAGLEMVGDGARATVVKDGGDDPDATHKAKIEITVSLDPAGKTGEVFVGGGKGVGVVTRPGLPVPVGEKAINPVPRRQIGEAVREALTQEGLKGAVSVTIEVEDGERIARNTFNPRLGIMGGISILGTRGTVKPFSNKSYRDTIVVSMDVAKASGTDAVALSTGGRSEGFLREIRPDLADFSFIQVADFFSFSLQEAAKRGFKDVLYTCFFGKMIKMAQGHPNTHARKSRIDFGMLAQWCGALGLGKEEENAVGRANTAREALGIILGDRRGEKVLSNVIQRAVRAARNFAGPLPNIEYYLFDFEGGLLSTCQDKGSGKGHGSAPE